MKVPVYDTPRVQTADAPGYSPRAIRTDYTLASDISQAGQQLGRAVDSAGHAIASAEKQAQELARADAEVEWGRRVQRRLMGDSSNEGRIEDAFAATDTRVGYLHKKGLDAFKSSGDVLHGIEQDRQEVAATLEDLGARDAFLRGSSRSMLAYRNQVEQHASQQWDVANADTLKAQMDYALGMAEAASDPEVWAATRRQVEESINALSRTPEEAQARLGAFRSANNAAAIRGMVARGELDDAEKSIESARAAGKLLGSDFTQSMALLKRAKDGQALDAENNEAARLVDGSASAVRNEDGYVGEKALRDAVPLEAYDVKTRTKVEAELNRRIAVERRKLELDIGQHRDRFSRSGGLDGEAEAFLDKYDRDWLLAFRAKEKAQARRDSIRKGGSAKEKSAASAAQKKLDDEFLWTLKDRLVDEPTASVEDVLQSFIAEKAKKGEAVTVSDVALAHAGYEASTSAKKLDTQEGVAEVRARQAFRAEAQQAFAAGFKVKRQPVDQALLSTRVGKALALYDERVRQNGGKPLDPAQVAELKAQLTTKVDVPVERWWGTGTTKGPMVDTFDAGAMETLPGGVTSPQAKVVKSWVYSPDRKQRMPRYADGTLGPIEQVR